MVYAQTTDWREAIAVINFRALISPESLGELIEIERVTARR